MKKWENLEISLKDVSKNVPDLHPINLSFLVADQVIPSSGRWRWWLQVHQPGIGSWKCWFMACMVQKLPKKYREFRWVSLPEALGLGLRQKLDSWGSMIITNHYQLWTIRFNGPEPTKKNPWDPLGWWKPIQRIPNFPPNGWRTSPTQRRRFGKAPADGGTGLSDDMRSFSWFHIATLIVAMDDTMIRSVPFRHDGLPSEKSSVLVDGFPMKSKPSSVFGLPPWPWKPPNISSWWKSRCSSLEDPIGLSSTRKRKRTTWRIPTKSLRSKNITLRLTYIYIYVYYIYTYTYVYIYIYIHTYIYIYICTYVYIYMYIRIYIYIKIHSIKYT